ncbi:metalloregulator ArsR/SmtB family transcription factor [Nesterenkonia sp. LB17]|uniref:ArsR/SmtB family transcription factor n=1 Tax=unclassified Nesterenkonia TaxID=2629769 RepID=UPI001F4C57EA|nr:MULTISPECIES: metalloregulator ArsR/SmtB family transcription factor [unclassified Nesterenkonia]MCH8561821.1 metalloregulator ArsR/SmtB family transcription factor [Nesterenkonia sp. YGD6]MCH8564650.1 metalloregulator ArsR/SmtB family transcription factor [Nesterenkonia sp. LB17]
MSVTFSALADPTRRDILDRLRRRPLTVSELAKHYPMSRAGVSQHLSVLERAELVSRNRRGQWIDCSITPASLDEASQWIENQRRQWNERLDHLEEYLNNHPSKEDASQKGEEQ